MSLHDRDCPDQTVAASEQIERNKPIKTQEQRLFRSFSNVTSSDRIAGGVGVGARLLYASLACSQDEER